MSHLHFPDGILPVWLIFAGFIITGLILGVSLNKLKQDEQFVKKTAWVAMMSALILIAMSIPLGFIHYHINLTVLVSLLIGPWFAAISVFVVNLFLSFIGHGGITVVGLNTLVTGFEVFLASFLFYFFRRFISATPAIVLTTMTTLILSSAVMVLIVTLAALSIDTSQLGQYLEEGQKISSGIGVWFAGIILPVVALGAAIEALIISFMMKYLAKVKPELVQHLQLTEGLGEEEKATKDIS